MATIRSDKKNVIALSWPGAAPGECCVILPGVTDVDDDAWENAQQNPETQAMLNSGLLIDIEDARPTGDDTTSPLGKNKSLVKFAEAVAITMVEAETESDVLKGWKRKEKRKNVKNAIKDRLKEL